jgi:hypothetical protein
MGATPTPYDRHCYIDALPGHRRTPVRNRPIPKRITVIAVMLLVFSFSLVNMGRVVLRTGDVSDWYIFGLLIVPFLAIMAVVDAGPITPKSYVFPRVLFQPRWITIPFIFRLFVLPFRALQRIRTHDTPPSHPLLTYRLRPSPPTGPPVR